MTRAIAAFAFALAACVAAVPAVAEWHPADVRPTSASRAAVLAAYGRAAGVADPRYAQRRERWTYVTGERTLGVTVTVRGEDFRAAVALNGAEYTAGRWDAVRWRADANDIAHATLADDQGDAVDRLPQSVFPFALADCELAGESTRFGAAWVLADRAPRDRAHWFYVDKATGRIAHEVTREGARTIVTAFDGFEPLGTMVRPRRWHVSDGDRARDLDVTVDDVEPRRLEPIDVAIPQKPRTFAPRGGARDVVALPAHFRGRTISVDVDLDGEKERFILDTGTASITLDERVASRRRWPVLLEHASVPHMSVGGLTLENASTLALPLPFQGLGGILGYDFFFGHVVHIEYAAQRVEVMSPEAAAAVFGDPATTVLPASFDDGLPLISAAFGTAAGERFALDTGSPRLVVLAPFARRYPDVVRTWTPATLGPRGSERVEGYLEGTIAVTGRRVSVFGFGNVRFPDVVAELEQPNDRADAIDIALDGIIGTDEMSRFDWWFDYAGGRIAIRRNAVR